MTFPRAGSREDFMSYLTPAKITRCSEKLDHHHLCPCIATPKAIIKNDYSRNESAVSYLP